MDEDDFATFGTPLEPLDEAALLRKKPIALEDQIVTDENGRRRFHGAFTGGFSAGFFNTAGSRDGWSPAHFKSSRSSRMENGPKAQRPEDFMDDEDLGEFGIAPQGLKASEQFRRPEAVARAPPQTPMDGDESDKIGPIPGEPVLDQFFRSPMDTIGSKLLRQMGWKPGQGVGPRLSRGQKSRQRSANERMLRGSGSQSRVQDSDGCSDEDAEVEVDAKYRDFLFAPDDIPDFVIKPKDDFFGIAYQGLDRSTLLGGSHINLFEPSSSGMRLQKQAARAGRLKIKGQAFGVGAYEEDDADIYAHDDMGQYDFALTNEENKVRAKNRKSRWGDLEKLSDTLEGFSLAERRSNVRRVFPMPELPRDFVPKRGVRKSRFEPGLDENLQTTNPSPNQRKLALLTPKERTEESPAQTCSEDQLEKLLRANVDQIGRPQALGSFQPFARDPAKQKRYEQFLVCMKNNRRDGLAILQPKTMTDWEREREKVEFERAALLYRPMSGTMNSKFVSAGSSEDAAETTSSGPKDAEGGTAGDAKKAAQMKMFGRLTHEKVEWHPDRLLCIRFNVKNPFSNNSVVGVAGRERSKFELFNFTEPLAKDIKTVTEPDSERDSGLDAGEPESERKEPQAMDIVAAEEPKPEKPPLDLFKSIFLDSSSSESESEESEEPKVNHEASNSKKAWFGTELESTEEVKPWEEKKENTLRNPTAPKGIFANIDFDRLNQKKPREVKEDSTSTKTRSPKPAETSPKIAETTQVIAPRRRAADFFEEQEESPEKLDRPFGPARPEHLRPRFTLKRKESSDEDSDDWVEDTKSQPKKKKKRKVEKKLKKEKKRKKERKLKKAKKRSKKKSKKHDSNTSASDSSASES